MKRLGGLLGLVCLVLAFGVSATGADYIDNFDTDPTGGGFVTTFATDYLVYTSDDSGSFWYDSAGGEIDHWGLSDGDVLTIELDGGGEFVFKSLRFKNSATDYDATISGIGTDAFSLTATKNSSELVLFEAPGGSATVDRIEITSTFVSGRLDDVTIEEPDADPPSFDSITRLTPPDEDTNADTLVFQATFSEEVQYVTIDDFEVTGSSATVTSVSSDTGTTIDLTASGGDLAGYEGIVGIDLAAGQDIADLADNALPAGEPTTDETYTLENTPPTDPTPSSTSHTLSVWSDDNTVDVEWSGAFDATGVAGYSYSWDTDPTGVPDTTQDMAHGSDPHTATSPTLADGDSHYFHIRTVDAVGNWTSTEHLGPFQIDTTPPAAPTGLDPASGTYTTDTSPTLSWDPASDPGGSGIRTTDAYRVQVTDDPTGWPLPLVKDYYTSSTSYSPTLSEGDFRWRVYVRDNAGNVSDWSDVHALTIDETPPTPTVTTSPDPIYQGALTLTVTVTYDETMDTGTSPVVTLTGANWGAQTSVGGDGWSTTTETNDTYTCTFVHDGTEEEIPAEVASIAAASGATDLAGNAESADDSPPFVVDTDAPDAPVVSGIADDTGVSADDEITNDQTLTISGTADPDVSVEVFRDSSSIGTTTANGSGVWSLADGSTLADATYVYTAEASDAVGNTSPASGDLSVEVDIDPPAFASFEYGTPATSPTNADTLVFYVETDEALASVVAGDFTVNSTSTAGVTSVDQIDGLVYDVTVSGGDLADYDGTVNLDLNSGQNITDLAGNALPTVEPTTDETYVVDNTEPVSTPTGGPSGYGNDPNPTFDFSATDTGGSGVDSSSATLAGPVSGGPTTVASGFALSDVAGDSLATDGSEDGSYTMEVSSTDHAGNVESTATWTWNHDTAGPTVTSVGVSDTVISDSDTGAGKTFVVEIVFSEPMTTDGSADPSPVLFPGVGSTLGSPSGSWNGTTDTYTVTYATVSDVGANEGSVTIDVTGAKDAAGNDQEDYTPEHELAIDTANPTISAITTSPDPIYEGALTLTVTVEYNEAMNPATSPVVTLTGSNWGAQTGGAWSDGDTVYTCSFTHNGTEEGIPAEVASIAAGSGATDLAGNAEEAADSPAFEVDTLKPTPMIVTSPDPIYEGALTLTVVVTYDEAMNPATSPVVALTGSNWGAQTPVGGTGWSTTYEANDTYTCTFTHDGTEEEIAAEVASIAAGSGATDVAGNAENDDVSDPFEVDTRKPRATVTVDHTTVLGGTPIYEGSLVLTVTVTYDEDMDQATWPAIALVNAGGRWGSQTPNDATGWQDARRYEATFTHDGTEEEILATPIARVSNGSGATDVAGNADVGDDSPVFEIDTRKPVSTVTVDHTTIAAGTPIYQGSLSLTVTVTYDEAMDPATTPTITLVNAGSNWGAQTNSGWSAGDTVFTASFTHNGTEETILGTPIARVSDTSGATDVAGNAATADDSPVFDIDTRRPEVDPGVSGVTVSRLVVIEDRGGSEDEQVVTVVFDEAMRSDGTADPTIVFGDGTWTSNADGAWSAGDTTWTETFTLTDNDEEILDVTVDVTGAKDAAGNDQEDYVAQPEFAIDTVKPRIVDIGATTPDGCYIAGSPIDLVMTFSEDIALTGTIEVTLDVGGSRFVHAILTLAGTRIAQGTYTVAAGENSCDLDVLEVHINAEGGLTDIAGNYEDNPLTLPPGGYMRNGVSVPVGQNLAENAEIVVDTTLPVAIDDPDGDEDRSGSNDSAFIQLREDRYAQYRLTTREETPAYIHVTFNDAELPCLMGLAVHDIPVEPEYGAAWIEPGTGRIRYSPERDYVGPDRFTYRIIDGCGNVSEEATVYVEVLRQLALEDLHVTACAGTPSVLEVTVFDPWIDPDDPDGLPFEFSIVDPPENGVVHGSLEAPGLIGQGTATIDLGSATFELTYVPALGFTGEDRIVVEIVDPFGGISTAVLSIAVVPCEGTPVMVPLRADELLPMIVPLSFASVHETAWHTVTLVYVEDGTPYASALSAPWDEDVGRLILTVDGGLLVPGSYVLSVPLGNGERVEMMIEAGDSK